MTTTEATTLDLGTVVWATVGTMDYMGTVVARYPSKGRVRVELMGWLNPDCITVDATDVRPAGSTWNQ